MLSEKKKGGFASGIGFVLAAAGSAVGLGNLWGFPFKTAENGGAAFVILYIACVLFIGFCTMICELFLGKRSQANPVTAFKKANPKLGWFGLIAIIVPFIISFYYSVLGGYTVKFAVNSFWGNTGNLANFAGSSWQVILCTGVFIAFALFIVMAGVKGGIEKASKILMPALFILLLLVVVFVLFLGEGVVDGLKFYLVPDWSKINGTSILVAMGQAFYSLSLGMGAMIVYGSYTGKEINIVKSTGMICLFDTLIALLAGLAIFPAVFHFASVEGIPADSLKLEGLTLMFVTLPKVFESIGAFGKIIEFFFFAMVVVAAVTSVISLFEVSSQFIIQKFKIKRKIATLCIAIITLLVSIPIGLSLGNALNGVDRLLIFGEDLLTFLDAVTNAIFMPACALFSCIAVGWFIGPKEIKTSLEEENNKKSWFFKFIGFMIKFIVPVLIGIIEVFGIIDLWKKGAYGVTVIITSLVLLGLIYLLYFLLLKGKETGTNQDEIDL